MTDDALRETLLSKQSMFNGRLFNVECWQVSLPDGKAASRDVVLLRGACAVVAVDAQGRLPLVRQHRIASGRFTWELPAGKFDSPEEEPLVCAQRELREETGLTAGHWQKLTVVCPSPAYCSEEIHLFLARDLSSGPAAADEGEFLESRFFSLKEAYRMCMEGEIQDSKTVIGILMAHALFCAGS